MKKHTQGGFTLIELVMVIVVVGVIGAVGAYIMTSLIRNSIYLPNKLNTEMMVSRALDIMIGGDGQARGLRFSTAITTVSDYQVVFNNQDGQSVSYRLDTGTNKLYRSINSGTESVFPYYASAADISMEGKSGKVFTYYDENETETAIAADVRRIAMTIVAKTGSGLVANWQGQSEQTASVAVNLLE